MSISAGNTLRVEDIGNILFADALQVKVKNATYHRGFVLFDQKLAID